ncbi:hypothetical protein AALP_AA1G002000 [Arabis alpina]|uniref:Transmembrane protein n=1 Tax=Arabis alpina TaxID=50452 RepID=A0A087HK51_ARAAL|nr:hypothetical protein AALP_AA1G002000 [Arabis alpina]
MNTMMKMKTRNEKKKNMSSKSFLLYSMIVSIFGGSFLSYWFYKYHPTNSNLWMVPIGLLSLVTPAFLSLSVLIFDLCDDDDDNNNLDLELIKV